MEASATGAADGRSVVVTGASGPTGRRLCRRLRADGIPVVAFSRTPTVSGLLASLGCEVRPVDVTDREAVLEALGEAGPPSSVYHLAAAFRTEHADRSEFDRVNVEGTGHVLDAAAAVGARRVVHCSTVGVHGTIDRPPATEQSPLEPEDHYQASKLEGERLALSRRDEGLEIVVVRPVGIYGPGDTRFLKLFRAIRRGHFVMIGSGRTLYHMTYVEDLVDGLLRASARPEAVGEVFIMAGPRYTTLNELVTLVAEAIDCRAPRLRLPAHPALWTARLTERLCRWIRVDPPLYARRMDFFLKDRAFDSSKARRLLGYRPRVSLREGLERTARWYRAEGLL